MRRRVLKGELGAGVYPSGKFGANAAWLRLQVLTHNLLELFKAAGLDKAYRQARPKRLRFAIFNQVGRVVRHAGERFLRVAQRVLEELVWKWRRRFQTSFSSTDRKSTSLNSSPSQISDAVFCL